MLSRFARGLRRACALLCFAGCTSYSVREQIDQAVCDRTTQTVDPEPVQLPAPKLVDQFPTTTPPAGAQPPETKKDGARGRRLVPPPGLPGADAPPIQIPPASA